MRRLQEFKKSEFRNGVGIFMPTNIGVAAFSWAFLFKNLQSNFPF